MFVFCYRLTFFFFLSLFVPFQTDRGPARKGAHIPNIRSENLKENSFSVCTLTRRNACNYLGCLTSPTDKWRSGFRTVGWRRRNWIEIDYNTTRQTLSFRGENSTVTAFKVLLCCGTDSVYRLSPCTLCATMAATAAAAMLRVSG